MDKDDFIYIPLYGYIYRPDFEDLTINTLLNDGVWERNVIQFFDEYIQEDFVIIDAGTCMALHAIYMSHLCPKGKIYAFEPSRINYEIAKKNIEINELKNVILSSNALGNEERIVYNSSQAKSNLSLFVIRDGLPTKMIDWLTTDHRHDYQHPIKMIHGDSLNLQRLDLIRLDCEGYEYNVLEGFKNTIDKFKPLILFECHEEFILDKDPRVLVESFGYKFVSKHDYDYFYQYEG